MKFHTSKLLLLIALNGLVAVNFKAVAEEKIPPPEIKKLYKVVDKHGRIHYSDQPSPGAKQVDIPEVPSISMRVPNIKIISLEEQLEKKRDPNAKYYALLGFTNLTNDGVIRNNGGTATFIAQIDPSLSKGHYLEFYIDGKIINGRQKEIKITAQEVTYGTHTASISVVTKQGSFVQKSETLTFNLLHVVRKNSQVNQNSSNFLAKNSPIRADFFKRNLPEHPKVPTYQAMKKAAEQSSDK